MTRLQRCDRGLKPTVIPSLVMSGSPLWPDYRDVIGDWNWSSVINDNSIITWPDYRDVIGDWNAILGRSLAVVIKWPDYRDVIGDWNWLLVKYHQLLLSVWPDYRDVIGDWNSLPFRAINLHLLMTRLQRCDRGLKLFAFFILCFYSFHVYDPTTEMW